MSAIVNCARSFLGCRYRHQGRGRDGVDCAGLVIAVAREALGSTFDVTGYARHARDESMLEHCDAQMQKIPRHLAQPGDVMVFRFDHQRHMGLLGDYPLGGLSLIHAYAPARQVVEVRLDPVWQSRALAAFRLPGA